MFSKNHYINSISLLAAGLINSLLIHLIYKNYSLAVPIIYFFAFVFIIAVVGNNLKQSRAAVVRILILVFSPAIYYLLFFEIGFLINNILVILVIFFSERYFRHNKFDLKFLLFALLYGVILAVNYTIAIVFIIYLLYSFRESIPKILLFVITTLLIFLPLFFTEIFGNTNTISFAIKPLFIYLPWWVLVFIIIVSIYSGWMVTDLQEFFFASGVILLVPALILSLVKIIQFGMPDTYLDTIYMTHCSVTILYFIISVKDYKTDRFLGKILAID